MAERVTQVVRRVAVSADSSIRVTEATRRVAVSADSSARVTLVVRRVALADYATLPHRSEAETLD